MSDSLLRKTHSRVPASVWIGLIVAIALDTLVQVTWKAAVLRVPASENTLHVLLDTARQPIFWGLLVLFVAQFLNWMLILAKADLSYAQPITALAYVTVAICSATIFHEHLPPLRIAGIGLILAGVWFVSGSGHRTHLVTP